MLEPAAAAGHTVTAFARDPKAVTAAGARVVAGDVLDPDAVLRAVDGADAVVSALGIGYSRAATTVYSAGTAHIIKAMPATGATRFPCVSTTSMAPLAWTADPVRRALGALVLHPLPRRPYAAMALMEQSVLAAPLDRTLVRASRLTSGPPRGRPGGPLSGPTAHRPAAAVGPRPCHTPQVGCEPWQTPAATDRSRARSPTLPGSTSSGTSTAG